MKSVEKYIRKKAASSRSAEEEKEGPKCDANVVECYLCVGLGFNKMVHHWCVELNYSVWCCKNCDSDDDLG